MQTRTDKYFDRIEPTVLLKLTMLGLSTFWLMCSGVVCSVSCQEITYTCADKSTIPYSKITPDLRRIERTEASRIAFRSPKAVEIGAERRISYAIHHDGLRRISNENPHSLRIARRNAKPIQTAEPAPPTRHISRSNTTTSFRKCGPSSRHRTKPGKSTADNNVQPKCTKLGRLGCTIRG